MPRAVLKDNEGSPISSNKMVSESCMFSKGSFLVINKRQKDFMG